MAVLRLAVASLVNRRTTALLTALAIALSVAMLLGVEKVRRDARQSFTNTLSGTDLIATTTGTTISGITGPDVTLLEFDQAPPESYDPYWVGWDRSGDIPE